MTDPFFADRPPVRRKSLLSLLAFAPAEPWMSESLCAQTDPETFFPEKGGTTRLAKRVCAACPVREECLAYAVDNQERHGIWGGLSERERRKLTPQSRRICRLPGCDQVVPVTAHKRRVYCCDEHTREDNLRRSRIAYRNDVA